MEPRRKVRIVVMLLVVALLIIPVGWIADRLSHPTSTATLQMNLVQSPPADSALGQWLATQSRLAKTSVRRGSGGNGGSGGAAGSNPSLPVTPTLTVLTVTYTTAGYHAEEVASSIVTACRQMGYQVNGYSVISNGNPFRDLGPLFNR